MNKPAVSCVVGVTLCRARRNAKGFRKGVPAGCVLHGDHLGSEKVESRTGYQVTTPLRTPLEVANSPLSQEHLNRAVCDGPERGPVHRRLLEPYLAQPRLAATWIRHWQQHSGRRWELDWSLRHPQAFRAALTAILDEED